MNLTLFMQVLPKAGLGWLGVFAVTIIIVAAVELLEHFKKVKCPICRTTLKPFPLAEICRRWECLESKKLCSSAVQAREHNFLRWGFLKEGRSMAQPQCGKSLF